MSQGVSDPVDSGSLSIAPSSDAELKITTEKAGLQVRVPGTQAGVLVVVVTVLGVLFAPHLLVSATGTSFDAMQVIVLVTLQLASLLMLALRRRP